MKKLLKGIAEFRRVRRPDYAETFARLALGQRPDALMVACSDSRVVPNLFASTEPGDLFVVRNVGNLIPPCGTCGRSDSDESEAAALEFAVRLLCVRDIIVCGHSECGAMHSLNNASTPDETPHLRAWLRHGSEALERLREGQSFSKISGRETLAAHNVLSQLNVGVQIEHLRSYRAVRELEDAGSLALHGWWFDIAGAEVYALNQARRTFELLDEQTVARMQQAD